MMKRKVIGIGETVYDIVFRNGQPQVAVPGGSTFNSMVSVGRCGVPAVFLSEVGSDKVGDIILDFMAGNGVDSRYVTRLPSKTPVSLAFLDEKNDATYSFYRVPVADRPDFSYPDINEGDIVIYGSFYALNPSCRPLVRRFLEYAKSSGAFLYYDVNFRPSHVKDLGNIGDALWENLELADVVRGSHEDFRTLFGMEDAEEVYEKRIAPRCTDFICTFGADPLKVFASGGFKAEYPVASVETVSTIGAGDSFNAGFAYGLIREGRLDWDALVACAQAFSACCCQSAFNYITPEFAATYHL